MAKNTGIAQFSQGRSDIHLVDPRKLVIKPGWNNRDEGPELEAHIDMLAQSIAEVGVKIPIQVKLENGELVVKAGHCRALATMRAIEYYKADIKAVKITSVDRFANDADLILEQIITNSGKPLTVMEEARVYKKLLDMGWNQGDIAKKVGKSNGRISQILAYLEMPQAVQAQVATGTISASLAQSVVKQSETPAAASQALQEAVAVAKSEGRKVKPDDLGRKNSMTVLKDAFDNSDIDCSDEAQERGFVTVNIPLEDWQKVRELLKL